MSSFRDRTLGGALPVSVIAMLLSDAVREPAVRLVDQSTAELSQTISSNDILPVV
jgi:hypothetical protein